MKKKTSNQDHGNGSKVLSTRLSTRQFIFGFTLLTAFTSLNISNVTAQRTTNGKVLVVLTTASALQLQEGKTYNTPGYYLDELTYPLKKLVDAGYDPVFTTIDGAKPEPDPFSKNKFFFNNDEQAAIEAANYVQQFEGLRHPEKISVVANNTSEYIAILVPGGFGPMQDLVTDPNLGKILVAFHKEGKPTGMICHGPVTLISTLPDANSFKDAMIKGDYTQASKLAYGWPYAGYRLTVFSSGEELLTQLGGKVTYFVSHALSQAGAHVDFLGQGRSNVIEDRELLTGQQPFSSEEFGDAFVKKINSYKRAH